MGGRTPNRVPCHRLPIAAAIATWTTSSRYAGGIPHITTKTTPHRFTSLHPILLLFCQNHTSPEAPWASQHPPPSTLLFYLTCACKEFSVCNCSSAFPDPDSVFHRCRQRVSTRAYRLPAEHLSPFRPTPTALPTPSPPAYSQKTVISHNIIFLPSTPPPIHHHHAPPPPIQHKRNNILHATRILVPHACPSCDASRPEGVSVPGSVRRITFRTQCSFPYFFLRVASRTPQLRQLRPYCYPPPTSFHPRLRQ